MEWDRILLNNQPLFFLAEVALRSSVMFICLLVVLRLAGKRGVKQLSVFEMVIIIALGSAAGDPMFYEDVGLLPALVVFAVVILMYRLVTWLTGKHVWFERLVEGKTQHLIKDGKFSVVKFEQESLAQDEFFSELRLKSVEHLGQVKSAYLETSGEISIYLYEDNEVRPGLPITPDLFGKKSRERQNAGLYACSYCGETKELPPGESSCEVCHNNYWVPAISTRRIV